jgi:F0F1-type ATP synthase membrane subunit b/b'
MELKANELQARYEELSAEALAQAQEARRALRVDGLEQKESAVDAARKQANARFDEGSNKLNAQFESARKEALSQVDALAREIKTKVLGA